MSRLLLLTGAPGWLGTRLLDALQHQVPGLSGLVREVASERIRCLVQPSARPRWMGARVDAVRGDLRDPHAVSRFMEQTRGATLIHAAGVIHPALRAREFWEVNVVGTQTLLEAAARSGVARVIYVSSSAAAGAIAPGSEDLRILGAYGRSKRAAEDCVSSSGLPFVILRPPWFHGPEQPPRQLQFWRMIRTGHVPIVGDGDNLRSVIYIDDLCQAVLKSVLSDRALGQTLAVADAHPYSMRDIIDTFRYAMREGGWSSASRVIALPAWMGRLSRHLDRTMERAHVYASRLHVLSELDCTIVSSNERARALIDYVPEVDLAEGARRTVAWMRETGEAP